MQITLIGLGKMGTAMAQRIVQGNFNLTVFNRTKEKMQPLIQAGAKAASSVKEAAVQADIVITALLDDASILQIVNGDDGFLSSLKRGAIHVNTATILPETAKLLARLHHKHGSIYIAAPVLGVPKVAAAGGLTTFAAGDTAAIERCTPVLNTYSANIVPIGNEPYQANVVKISVNYLLAASIEAMGEIYTFAEKSNVNLDIINKLFHTIYAHLGIKRYVDKIKQRDFDDVNFDLKAGFKDLCLFQKAFTDVHVAPTLANIVKDKMMIALAQGMSEKDWSIVTEITRKEAGLD
ncbi:MAG TPA: NAD(P)-dependent oxidoreductase [Gammaproteobacteria bacterium]|jgi:3-hydroxyisobutyrate dehydrogenase-like beta-hydroxyacid dehydrogenase|nr:NAD(P)-dependent oxidoreductase [Gammaproteobacteria bacterium]